jgi:hypothetical protein
MYVLRVCSLFAWRLRHSAKAGVGVAEAGVDADRAAVLEMVAGPLPVLEWIAASAMRPTVPTADPMTV